MTFTFTSAMHLWGHSSVRGEYQIVTFWGHISVWDIGFMTFVRSFVLVEYRVMSFVRSFVCVGYWIMIFWGCLSMQNVRLWPLEVIFLCGIVDYDLLRLFVRRLWPLEVICLFGILDYDLLRSFVCVEYDLHPLLRSLVCKTSGIIILCGIMTFTSALH